MSVVENDQPFAVENVSVMILLESSNETGPYYTNWYHATEYHSDWPKGCSFRIFTSPIQTDYIAYANLLSVIPVSPDNQRYLQTELQIDEMTIYPDGQHASITGVIEFPPEQPEASTVWISAFAYDVQNNIVGIRKWVADDIRILSGRVKFDFDVYSLGSPIDHVDVLTEARP